MHQFGSFVIRFNHLMLHFSDMSSNNTRTYGQLWNVPLTFWRKALSRKVGRDIWNVVLEGASQVCGSIYKTSCDMMECKPIYTAVLSEKSRPTKSTYRSKRTRRCRLYYGYWDYGCLIEAPRCFSARRKEIRKQHKHVYSCLFHLLFFKHREPHKTQYWITTHNTHQHCCYA